MMNKKISIGYKKGIDEISLNDFDKVPLEIILFVAIIIGCIPLIILDGINGNYNAIISLGNILLNLENINIVQLIKQSLGEFEDKFNKCELDVILDNNEKEIIISADNKYMYRIIENLFSNISKYALDNSRVYIDIKKTQKNIILEMKNISKERLNISADELMQRFVRGDKSRTTEGS